MSLFRRCLGASDLSWEAKGALPVSKLARETERVITISKTDLRILFRTFGVLRRAICLLADLETARGFQLWYSDNDTKNCIETFLKNARKNNHFGWDLKEHMRHASINTDAYGNDFRALLLDRETGKKFVAMQPLSPIITDFQRDSTEEIIFERGRPKGFCYRDENTSQQVNIDVPVAHNAFVILGDEVIGYSLAEACFNSATRIMAIQEGTAQAITKFGAPFLDVSVKRTDAYDSSVDIIEKVNEEIQGITMGAGYVHPDDYNVQFQNPVFPRGVAEFLIGLYDEIVTTTGIPKHLLVGQGQLITKATAESLQRMLNPFLEPRQEILSRTFETQIFDRVLEKEKIIGKCVIEWNEVMPSEDPVLAQKIQIMANTQVGGKDLISWEEAREMAGFPANASVKADLRKKKIDGFVKGTRY